MNFPLYIARRINGQHIDRRKVSRPAIHIATAGVAIGLAVMIITVAVVLGFKHTIRDKVAGFGSHIQVLNVRSIGTDAGLPVCVNDSLMQQLKAIPGVRHVERYAMTQGILKTDHDFLGVLFKGIGPEYDTTFLAQNIVEGTLPQFHDTNPLQGEANSREHPYPLVISKTMADKLKLHAGDIVFAYFIGQKVSRVAYKVCAVYQTNMSRFDDTFCITDLYVAKQRNSWRGDLCSGAELLVDDFEQLEQTDEQLVDMFTQRGRIDSEGNTLTSLTIHQNYPTVFQWLDLLDVNVWIILALMVALAGFTMISGLLIIILERTQMIGVLKALGARNTLIRHTFLWFAVFIIGRGLLWGNIIGIGIVLLQQWTGFVRLDAQTYYVSQAPMELNLLLIALLNIATLLICVLVLIGPSYLISRIHPARSMRYE
jgi:lipoprotein-releasing system permease protein